MNKFAFAATVALAALTAAAPAFADTLITSGQWYYAAQAGVGDPVVEGGSSGFDAPLSGVPCVVGTCTGTSVDPGGPPVYDINMASAGYVVVTDVEIPGDQYAVMVDGAAATPTTNDLSIPGQAGLANGWTSVPCDACEANEGEDIGYALNDPNFSSGTFYLPQGADTIDILFEGVIGSGTVDFYAASPATPEPGTILLLGSALAGLGMLRRRKKA